MSFDAMTGMPKPLARAVLRRGGLEVFAHCPEQFSSSLTAVLLPAGFNEAELRRPSSFENLTCR